MAQNKKVDVKSVSNKNVATIQNEMESNNPSVSDINERFEFEQAKHKELYNNAKEEKVIRTIRDISKSISIPSITHVNRDIVRGYLKGNIYANSKNLINASRYLFYRSAIYNQMVYAFADMYCLNARILTPDYSFINGMDINQALKQYDDSLTFLERLSPQNNFISPLINMYIDDITFNLFFQDGEGSMFWRIDPNEAIIDSVYMYRGGYCLGMALDMSKWKSAQKQKLIEFLGEPLISMWKTYEDTGVKYVHVPVEYSMVLKFHIDMLDSVIPPLLHYLIPLANLNDLADTQSSADQLAYYKLIYLPMPVVSGAKNPDSFQVTPDLSVSYFDEFVENGVPGGISTAVIPGEGLKTIDFSDNVSVDVNRVENSQQQILGAAGGIGALLNGNKLVNNSALIKAALKEESAYVLNSVLPQIETWINLQLYLNVNKPCTVKQIPATIFTKDDYIENFLKANQYSYSYRMALGTLMDVPERQTMAQLMFETQALNLQDMMRFPLQSSYTTSNDGSGEPGAPQKKEEDLSPKGEKSRNR